MTHIYLVRHAETNLNADPTTIWWRSNHIEISKIWHKQWKLLQNYIATSNNLVDVLYVSTAIRTKQTSYYVAKWLWYSKAPIIDDRLQEIDQWDWTGKNRKEIYTQKIIDIIQKDPLWFTPPNGESINMVWDRMNEVLDEIIQKYPDWYARIVSHGVAIAATIMKRFGITWSTVKSWPHSNTWITTIHYDPNPKSIVSWRILSYNNDSHLPPEYRTIQLV